MLRDEHLPAAVAEGIITAPQAQALRDFAAARERARIAAQSHEERFRFMRGFNDFFFATGVLLLGAGLIFFAGSSAVGNLVAALILWALAELLVQRMRLVLPGILLACFFVDALYRSIPVEFWELSASDSSRIIYTDLVDYLFGAGLHGLRTTPSAVAIKALVAGAAAMLFYARFRLPFALLLIAGSLVLAITAASRNIDPSAGSVALLFSGFVVFAAAMAFDLSDRERLTRRADCAFWLHLLAAPLIVHSLISRVAPQLGTLTLGAASEIVAIVAVLAVVALIIDRRALLVSTLSYLGVVIAYAIRNAGAMAGSDRSFVFFATLVVLGALVLCLGVGWQPLRHVLLLLLPRSVTDRLPPAGAALPTPQAALTR